MMILKWSSHDQINELSCHLLRGAKENHETPQRKIAGILAEIRTESVQSTSLYR
jgi:hypothetical protein